MILFFYLCFCFVIVVVSFLFILKACFQSEPGCASLTELKAVFSVVFQTFWFVNVLKDCSIVSTASDLKQFSFFVLLKSFHRAVLWQQPQ